MARGGGRVRELEQELARLRALYRLTSLVSQATNLQDVLAEALRCLHATLGADRSSILLFDEHGRMRFRAWRGLSREYREAVDGHSPWDADEPQPTPIVVSDVDEADAMTPYRRAFAAEGIRSLAFVPLVARERLLGKFMVYFAEPHHYSTEDVEVALNIAQHVAMAVDRSRSDAQHRRNGVILDSIGDGVTVHDSEGNLLFANPAAARFTMCESPEELIREGAAAILERFTMFHPDGRPMSGEELPGPRCLESGELAEALVRFRARPEGEERWAHVRAAPVHGPDGELSYAVNIFNDVTEEQRMALRNAELFGAERVARREAEAAVSGRDLLLAVVSHDLRTPLTAISVAASMLARVPAAEDHAATIRMAASSMDRLISDLLDYERLRAGTLRIARGRHRCGELLEEAVDLMGPSAAERDIDLRVTSDFLASDLSCDRGRVVQVLSNLISNAIKFSTPGSAVSLSAEERGGTLELRVVDTGPGIAPEQLERIFERHYQAKPDGRGVGLGLSIAQGIVHAHGGSIRVDSELGHGTTVTFTLPVSSAP